MDYNLCMNFYERLKELREEKNLSQTELAKLTGLSQSAITKWENKLREPSMEGIIILAKFFDVSADYLLGISDS